MVDYRRILVLLLEGRSYRDVVEVAGCSHRDVSRVREAVRGRGSDRRSRQSRNVDAPGTQG
jgi:uncharacterized protein YerC